MLHNCWNHRTLFIDLNAIWDVEKNRFDRSAGLSNEPGMSPICVHCVNLLRLTCCVRTLFCDSLHIRTVGRFAWLVFLIRLSSSVNTCFPPLLFGWMLIFHLLICRRSERRMYPWEVGINLVWRPIKAFPLIHARVFSSINQLVDTVWIK